jgi:hypothetical protein
VLKPNVLRYSITSGLELSTIIRKCLSVFQHVSAAVQNFGFSARNIELYPVNLFNPILLSDLSQQYSLKHFSFDGC